MEKSTMKLKILMTLAIGPILLNCQSPQQGFTTEFDVLPQMVYPKYRRGVTPEMVMVPLIPVQVFNGLQKNLRFLK